VDLRGDRGEQSISWQEDALMTDKRMKLRYDGVCRLCGAHLPKQADAIYEATSRTVRCVECLTGESVPAAPSDAAVSGEEPPPPETAGSGNGVAGWSARREYERRKARDEARLRQRWGKLGGMAVALSDEKQSTKAWATGAVGEERLGARLDSLASDTNAALHDRRIPGSKANIDHIAVTTAGIWVIDAKREAVAAHFRPA
jgi:hypothetical protein